MVKARGERWRTTAPDRRNRIHVEPIGDLRTHHRNATCWCKPRVEHPTAVSTVIVHNSMDGRELIEQHGVN